MEIRRLCGENHWKIGALSVQEDHIHLYLGASYCLANGGDFSVSADLNPLNDECTTLLSAVLIHNSLFPFPPVPLDVTGRARRTTRSENLSDGNGPEAVAAHLASAVRRT